MTWRRLLSIGVVWIPGTAALWAADVTAGATLRAEPGPPIRAAAQDDSLLRDPTRPESELERDPGSLPLQVYEWLDIRSGQTIVDIMPFGGYNSHLLGRLVGASGRVFSPYLFGEEHLAQLIERFETAGLENVEPLVDLSSVASESVDVVLSVRNLHDMYIPAIEEQFGFHRDPILAHILRVLKPGGVFGVVDARTPDPGVDDSAHRINQAFAIEQLEGYGFEFVDSSELLAVADDDASVHNFPTRWVVDRFLLKFRKPGVSAP